MEKSMDIAIRPAVPGLSVYAPKLGKRLASAVQSTTKFAFVTDAQLDDNPNRQAEGLETWQVPSRITQPMIDDAKEQLAVWQAYLAPCQLGRIGEQNTVVDWLSQLGTMCAGQKMSVDEAKEKIASYAFGLRYPEFCFSQGSLYRAARKFKFFPTFSEVCDFLDDMARPARSTFARIELLSLAQPTSDIEPERVKRWEDMTPDEQAAHDKMMSDLRKRLSAAGVGNDSKAVAARRRMEEMDAAQRARIAPLLDAKRRALMGEESHADGN